RQEEGIDYDKVFAPVARIEAIRRFLTFASYMGFMVYQMDVKSAFLYREIKEVYVTQPKGFEDPHNPKHVYRVVKALYGLHQAPRAWHIILVQVYVNDIIFGSTNKAWCDEFKVLMKGEFKMSAMGELTFFLGLQVKQLSDGIFISQDKSMIGSLMYLTASRPDIMFALEAYSDSDYVGSHGDRKSTTGGCQFLGRRLISWHCKKQTIVATSSTEAEYVAAASCCGQLLVHAVGLVPTGSYADPVGYVWILLLLKQSNTILDKLNF
nr:retrovirus-related Pol polyprotein from transposon TNT 1-94 [Tanacetum cinerariifolium]